MKNNDPKQPGFLQKLATVATFTVAGSALIGGRTAPAEPPSNNSALVADANDPSVSVNTLTLARIVELALGVSGLAALSLGIKYRNEPYEKMLQHWNIEIEEAKTPDDKTTAYRLRGNGFPNYKFDTSHPDNERIGFQNAPDGSVTDNIDRKGGAKLFVIRQKGKVVGTFRLIPPEQGEAHGFMIDNVFTTAELSSIDRNTAMETSLLAADKGAIFRQNPLRSISQAQKVIALGLVKTIVDFAHDHGVTVSLAPTTKEATAGLRAIGINSNYLPVRRDNAMGRDRLYVVHDNLSEAIKKAPPEVQAIVDPEGHFHTPAKNRTR